MDVPVPPGLNQAGRVRSEMASEREARDALERHRRAVEAGALDNKDGYIFEEWYWQSGIDRVVWWPFGGATVYKVQWRPGDWNEREDSNMSKWRDEGRDWAPNTDLHYIEHNQPPILAMPYFPDPIESQSEIPKDVDLAGVPDTNIVNFRKSADGHVWLIDAGDIVPRKGF